MRVIVGILEFQRRARVAVSNYARSNVESQRNPNFVVIDEVCRDAKRRHSTFGGRSGDGRVAMIKPANEKLAPLEPRYREF